ncbi:carbohydrate kinase family protein [Gillisia limnaea]|uniref:PfkB domain protein n=1 Tax=Gillisia limnaea (strain DSM 15749 / LMG 21470 / R-8282) TaxID=865937 RepID=H2BXZ7_GILLR|nr:carbohydrate kinase [Gillisia limnaea]EHQ03203.1 PfkB domain protein [Gillisia limnaea DSM 15749]
MPKNVVCFGEVLWDNLPSGKKIGGAPLNVALRLNSFGNQTSMISRVGNDIDGKNILDFVLGSGIQGIIQIDKNLETGIVDVEINEEGNANYHIKQPCAWDNIKYEKELVEVVKDTDAFIFGSLACRSEESASTLFRLLDHATFKVLDVNLRKPHYSIKTLLKLMEKADLIKLNEEELNEICEGIDTTAKTIVDKLKIISEKTSTSHICVTRGAQGVVLYYHGEYYHNSGFSIKVRDTVGAGDSFLAAYVSEVLKNTRPAMAMDFACAVGSLVASKEGANSQILATEIKKLMWMDEFVISRG